MSTQNPSARLAVDGYLDEEIVAGPHDSSARFRLRVCPTDERVDEWVLPCTVRDPELAAAILHDFKPGDHLGVTGHLYLPGEANALFWFEVATVEDLWSGQPGRDAIATRQPPPPFTPSQGHPVGAFHLYPGSRPNGHDGVRRAPVTAAQPQERPTRLTKEEIADLRSRAIGEAGPFGNPRIVAQPITHPWSWATAILGRPYGGPRTITWPERYLLHLAMQAEPEPPARQATHREPVEPQAHPDPHRVERGRIRATQCADDAREWAAIVQACPVPVTVHSNLNGPGRTRKGMNIGALAHVVPVQDAVSGRNRRHPADRALCESPDRARPRRLGEPHDGPATCVSCLRTTPLLRLPGAPPPTAPVA